MPPLIYIHASEAARTTAGGRGIGGTRNFNEFLMRRELNITNGAKRMAEFLGHSKDLITLSFSFAVGN